MNTLELANINTSTQSMTSLQIAELVESRHDSVKRTIERLMEQEVISQPPTVDGEKSANGVTTQLYFFTGEQGKLDSITVVAQLCPHFTARLVQRWQQLENQQYQMTATNAQLENTLAQLANGMATLADGMGVLLQQNNHSQSYIKLLETNQKGTVKITHAVADEVKRYRALGYNMAEIARHLRISKTSVSLIVNDKYKFSDLLEEEV